MRLGVNFGDLSRLVPLPNQPQDAGGDGFGDGVGNRQAIPAGRPGVEESLVFVIWKTSQLAAFTHEQRGNLIVNQRSLLNSRHRRPSQRLAGSQLRRMGEQQGQQDREE
jgi:hypothetical protein